MDIIRVYTAGEHDYYIFRIPALVATQKGTVLAFCEARRGTGGDWDPIDIVLRRSTDGGATWGPIQVLATSPGQTVNNPVPIVDHVTGAIHFVHQVEYGRAYYLRSDDEGLTWTEPVDITSVIETYRSEWPWLVVASGPGHGLQLENGRLIVPVWISTGEERSFGPHKLGHRPAWIVAIYSDDHGQTWQPGEVVGRPTPETVSLSESQAVQLSDGRVMMIIRNRSRQYRRMVSYSADGISVWTTPEFHPDLYEPICMASIIRVPETGRLLFTNPDSRYNPTVFGGLSRMRENLTVRVSDDDGKTWPLAKVIDPGWAGYSDLAVGPDGTIYCLYEGGTADGNMARSGYLNLARFTQDWLPKHP